MATRIIVTGRGGTGKSTFCALAARALKGTKILIDADPDQCLSALLGVDLHANGIKTVSEALYDIQQGGAGESLDSMPLPQKIDYLMNLSCLYESPDFDLLTLGVKWTRGCYCAPNNTLRVLIGELTSHYDWALFDSPAGLEHLNRRIVSEADDIFAIIDPSAKALRNAERVAEMAGTVGFSYKNLYTVTNYRFSQRFSRHPAGTDHSHHLGSIQMDERVQDFDWEGRSLLELPDDSPACQSVRQILKKAGYRAHCVV